MKCVPASIDGDLVLIKYGQGFPNVVLAGGDRPSLAASGYLEGKIYTYSRTQSEDQTFEEYEPGRWRKYLCSEWNKRLIDEAQLIGATIFKTPRYCGVLVTEMAWPRMTHNGTRILVVLARPYELALVRSGDPEKFYTETPGPLGLSLHEEQVRFSALVPQLVEEGWDRDMEERFCKEISLTELELEPEKGVPLWLREAIAGTRPRAG